MNIEKRVISNDTEQVEENLLTYIKGGNLSTEQEESSECCGLQFACNNRGKKEDVQDVIQFC